MRQGASWQPSVVGLLQAVFVPSSSSRATGWWWDVSYHCQQDPGGAPGSQASLPRPAVLEVASSAEAMAHGGAQGLLLPGPGQGDEGGLRVEDSPSARQESWARPRKSSLPFFLVLGTRPCRASSVAMPSCTRVQMAFFGLAGPALAGSGHCRPRLGCSEPLWHFRSPTGHPLGRRSMPMGERWLLLIPSPCLGQFPAASFPTDRSTES